MNRRAFLSVAAGAPLVFGLRELLAQDPAPDFIDSALKRMKATRRFGVFLVIPEAEAARKTLGQGLVDRLPTGSKAGNSGFELFCAHVFVCVSPDQAAKRGLGAKVDGPMPGILRMLVNPEGKQVAADRITLDVFEDSAKFIQSFGAFIHGKDGDRLRDHAREIEKTLSGDLKKAAEHLSGEPADATKALETLVAAADSIAPWLLQLSRDRIDPRFSRPLWTYYLQQSAQDPEPV